MTSNAFHSHPRLFLSPPVDCVPQVFVFGRAASKVRSTGFFPLKFSAKVACKAQIPAFASAEMADAVSAMPTRHPKGCCDNTATQMRADASDQHFAMGYLFV
jgi:hypothetical protein